MQDTWRPIDLCRKLRIYKEEAARGVCGSCSDELRGAKGGEREGRAAQPLPSRAFRLLQILPPNDAHKF